MCVILLLICDPSSKHGCPTEQYRERRLLCPCVSDERLLPTPESHSEAEDSRAVARQRTAAAAGLLSSARDSLAPTLPLLPFV